MKAEISEHSCLDDSGPKIHIKTSTMFFSPFLDCQWTPKGNEIWHRVMKGATHYEMQGRSAASRAPDCSAQDEQRTMLSGLENVGDVGLLAGTSKMRHCHGKEASSNNGTCLQFASDRGLTETTSYLQRFKLWLSFDKIPSNKTFTSPCHFFFFITTPHQGVNVKNRK